MKESNLNLWNSVCTTDPEFTKFVGQRGGFTAIDAQYLIMKATEVFGPYGLGFGLSLSTLNYEQLETTGMVIHSAVFFYKIGNERASFPIHNAIKFRSGSPDKPYYDEDFAKKLETNTLSKALSKIGFSADVYLGMFDDKNYQDEIGSKFAVDKVVSREEQREREEQELKEWVQTQTEKLRAAQSMDDLKATFTHIARKLKVKGADYLKQVSEVKDEVKAALESEK